MEDEHKTKGELISELTQLRHQIAYLLEDLGDGDKQKPLPTVAEWTW